MSVSQLKSSSGTSGKTLYVQKFTGSGTFTLPSGYGAGSPLTVEALVVGGGGGCAGTISVSGTTQYNVGGAGGGGGARSGVLTLTADAPIVVGQGGAGGVGTTTGALMGGNGGCSVVGSTVKNMWINPQMLPSNPIFGGSQMSTSGNVTFNAPGAMAGAVRGGTFAYGGGNLVFDSQPYRLTPGQTYTLSGYAESNLGSATFTVTSSYFTSSAYPTVNSSSTSSSLGAGATAWTRFSYTFTVPAGSDVAQFRFTLSSAVNWWWSNFQLEAGSSATAYVDGDSAGYAWAGAPAGSETVANTASLAVAGGGGGGDIWRNGTVIIANTGHGLMGATTGGSAVNSSAAGSTWFGGHGGGAGGAADQATLQYTGTALTFTAGVAGYTPQYGAGSYGITATSSHLQRGRPGVGVGDYGRGGHGHLIHPTIPSQGNGVPLEKTMTVVPNSGQGGSGWVAQTIVLLTGNATYGNNGADGVVILRYWA